jgi:hypothetical protein
MLSDKQVNELENLIVFSTMDNLPLILSRAIPLLFSELRLVRATLDSKVGDFLGGIGNADDERAEVDQDSGHSGLPQRAVPVADRQQVPGSGHSAGDQALAGGQGATTNEGDGTPKRRRSPRKKVGGSVLVDTGAGQPQVGGQDDPAAGFDSVLGIEASPRLKGGE